MSQITTLILCYRASDYAIDKYLHSGQIVDLRSGYDGHLPEGQNFHVLLSMENFVSVHSRVEHQGRTYSRAVPSGNSKIGIICIYGQISEECIRCRCSPSVLVLPSREDHFFVCEDCFNRERLYKKLTLETDI